MKGLKRGVLAFLVGELIVINKKDKSFKSNLKKKKGRDKLSYLVETLIDFNKELIDDVQQEAKKLPIQEKIASAKQRVHQETENIQHKITHLEKERDTMDTITIQKHVQYLIATYTTIEKKAKKIIKEMDDTYDIKETLVRIKQHIKQLDKKST